MSTNSERIASLNDRFRTSFIGGDIVITPGISALDDAQRILVLGAVQSFSRFCEDNDPYGERDFGSIDLPGLEKVFWKIDYYDPSLEFGSEDPANPLVTRRVLTIMLASEY
jgi:hypothetical protein